jgi:hypothetical protein
MQNNPMQSSVAGSAESAFFDFHWLGRANQQRDDIMALAHGIRSWTTRLLE